MPALDAAARQPPAVQIGVFDQQDAASPSTVTPRTPSVMPRLIRDQAKNSGRVRGSIRVRHVVMERTIGPAVGLNSRAARFIGGAAQEHRMLALYIILGFVAVLAAINFIEFGRVD
ncbi:hypothetical protein [Brevundimonas basaltis]|uniref:Uncharacterized protein n=1 Tax=Brevundimonas basaltis TaxID=472166 RepID=A0A7W8HYS4_9CAUL|nr:hypothetical protein [Brevundimonas basaltis]